MWSTLRITATKRSCDSGSRESAIDQKPLSCDAAPETAPVGRFHGTTRFAIESLVAVMDYLVNNELPPEVRSNKTECPIIPSRGCFTTTETSIKSQTDPNSVRRLTCPRSGGDVAQHRVAIAENSDVGTGTR